MPRPLKVYRAHIGFFDTIVAAHSQKEALAAWGGSPEEFRKGFASVTRDDAALRAALAEPGRVLYRPFGSKGGFSAEKRLPKIRAPAGARKQRAENEKQKRIERAKAGAEEKRAHAAAKEKLENTLKEIQETERALAEKRKAAKAEYERVGRRRSR